MDRLRINNNEDIQKVIRYEICRGYNRRTPHKKDNKLYEVKLEAGATCTVESTIRVWANSEEEAERLAEFQCNKHGFDIDDSSDLEVDKSSVEAETIRVII